MNIKKFSYMIMPEVIQDIFVVRVCMYMYVFKVGRYLSDVIIDSSLQTMNDNI